MKQIHYDTVDEYYDGIVPCGFRLELFELTLGHLRATQIRYIEFANRAHKCGATCQGKKLVIL
jgi:hypothetical protein